jgi:glycosyltransferase involved in cell wall biosynthesis
LVLPGSNLILPGGNAALLSGVPVPNSRLLVDNYSLSTDNFLMRIAMIGPFGLSPKSTMRSRALGLARPLAARGHQVRLFMPPWHTPGEADRSWAEDGVELRYIRLPRSVPAIMRQLIREVRAWRPEVIHCFKPKAYSGLAGWWFWQCCRRQVRLVIDSDDWEGWGGWNERESYNALQKRFFAWQEQWGMRHNHALTVASRTLESLAWGMGIAAQRVAYVPNGPGIPLRTVTAAERQAQRQALGLGERPALLLYSRLFEFDTGRLADILAGVRAAVPDLVLLAVGAGLFAAEAGHFRQQLAQRGLLDMIVDTGWVALEQLPPILAAADAGIYLMDDTLLNRAKCPVKLADMVHAGVPLVAEAVGQVTEYLRDGETAILRPSGDVAGLTAALRSLLTNSAERQRLASAAQSYLAQHFDWLYLARRVENVYQ